MHNYLEVRLSCKKDNIPIKSCSIVNILTLTPSQTKTLQDYVMFFRIHDFMLY